MVPRTPGERPIAASATLEIGLDRSARAEP